MNTKKFWALSEAEKIVKRFQTHDTIKLEIGYSPSGKIHIGTFHEAKRTNTIIQAIKTISDKKCKLICFSDDMDGLRKIPENIEDKEMLIDYIQHPLSKIPDPHKRDKSYAEYYNNNMKKFMENLNIDCEFKSSTEEYEKGKLNDVLKKVYDNYDTIMKIMLPTLSPERQKTYSPFLPICKYTKKVLQVPTKLKDNYTIEYNDYTGRLQNQSILNGNCKMQWKVDFPARWVQLGIHYEMMGKDHTTNFDIYTAICKALGGKPPLTMMYEMFLNEEGKKISKSDGNKAVALEDWLDFTIPEALEFFILQSPRTAKIMTYQTIIKSTDEYIQAINSYAPSEEFNILNAIHGNEIPKPFELNKLNFASIINIIDAMCLSNVKDIYTAIKKYDPNIKEDKSITRLIEKAINYTNKYLKQNTSFLKPNELQKQMLIEIKTIINQDPEELSTEIYTIGKKFFGKEKLKDFFSIIYQILLGTKTGPRFPSFIELIGKYETIKLIDSKIN